MNVFIKSYFFVTAAVVLHGAYKGWFCLSQTLGRQGEGGGSAHSSLCPLQALRTEILVIPTNTQAAGAIYTDMHYSHK